MIDVDGGCILELRLELLDTGFDLLDLLVEFSCLLSCGADFPSRGSGQIGRPVGTEQQDDTTRDHEQFRPTEDHIVRCNWE